MRKQLLLSGLMVMLVAGGSGCGSFMARRMAQSPNTYPTWFAPEAPVALNFSPKFLTNFPVRFVEVGPPAARLRYRVVDPANYDMRVVSTNWGGHRREKFEFSFRANIPAPANSWSGAPRGTVVLLHGYGLSQFAMAPWALRLAQEGWRCVLVDLRGHGKSTGKRIYFGLEETHDLSRLLDDLGRQRLLASPVAAMGESYGASLALRWKTVDPRVASVVAIAPYAQLSNAVMNIRREYASWMPPFLIRAGLRKLPSLLGVPPGALDITTVLKGASETALFAVGDDDRITPKADVASLRALAAPGSEFVVVPKATHESVTFFFNDLFPPVSAWLDKSAPATELGGNLPGGPAP